MNDLHSERAANIALFIDIFARERNNSADSTSVQFSYVEVNGFRVYDCVLRCISRCITVHYYGRQS